MQDVLVIRASFLYDDVAACDFFRNDIRVEIRHFAPPLVKLTKSVATHKIGQQQLPKQREWCINRLTKSVKNHKIRQYRSGSDDNKQ